MDAGPPGQLLAYPLLALDLTGSPAEAGLVTTVATASRLAFRLPAGALVDRWNRRRTMLGCDMVRAAVLGAVALGVATDHLPFAYLMLAALVEGAATVFFLPAETAALRRIVPREQLPLAFSQNEARSHGATLAGPPLGGLLYGIGRALPFVGDFLSYLLSLIAVYAIRTPLDVERRRPRPAACWPRSARDSSGPGNSDCCARCCSRRPASTWSSPA